MKRGKDETDSKTSGYNRQQKSSTTKEVEQSDSDDVEITISIPISKRRDIDNEEKSSILEKSTSQNAISSSSSSLQNEPNKRKEENPISTSSSPNEELKSLIRSRLSKASGYRADTSSLPKGPREKAINPFIHRSKEERERIIANTPSLMEERVGAGLDPEKVRAAQIHTYNKMVARACGRRRT